MANTNQDRSPAWEIAPNGSLEKLRETAVHCFLTGGMVNHTHLPLVIILEVFSHIKPEKYSLEEKNG